MIENCEIFCEGRTYRFRVRIAHNAVNKSARREWIEDRGWHRAIWQRGEPYEVVDDEGFRETVRDHWAMFIRYEDAFHYMVAFT